MPKFFGFDFCSQFVERSQTRALEDEIFAATISMCSSRILCRLRFVPNHRKKKKQPFKTVLQDAIRSLVELGDGNPVDQLSALSLFVSRARETVRLTDSWTKHQTIGQLQDLIQNIYHLKQISGLEALLDKIPNRAMSPSSRRNLVNIISKTARYREAARFLCRTAKQFPVVRNMKVTLVNLPREAFQRVSTNAYTPSLPDRITQIEGVSRKKCLDHMCRVMQVTEIQASEQFASRTKKTMKEAKIHAEIQLLFFCELNPSTLPPRVICSSKDACFLCNAFLRMHGKMHIPRQHGRLYSGWRLPFVPELNDLQQRFNSVLEGHIQQAFSNILSRNKKSLYPDPNESTILTLPVSVSTVPDTSTPKPVAQGRETFPTRISHRSITSEGERLVQGELPLNAISASHTTQLYRGGPIEIYVERAADIVEVVPEDLSREIAYRVAWLSLEESKRLLEHENMSCVDAEAIQGEVLHELDNQGCLFLRFHKDVVKISV
jgi:hypothetical protein